MIEYKETTEAISKPIAIICDICGKRYRHAQDDDIFEELEIQEFQHIGFHGGSESVFGNGSYVECDICQHCLMKMIGEHCYVGGERK